MRMNTTKVTLTALIAFALLGYAGPVSAYRAVYNGHYVESSPTTNPNDNVLLHNTIRWLCGRPLPEICQVDHLHSFPTFFGGFDAAWPDITVRTSPFRPVTLAALEALVPPPDVVIISNAWHGPPDEVPGAFPGGEDWVYPPVEGDAIAAYLDAHDAGILITAGSFGQFSVSGPPPDRYSNYDTFSALMGVEATEGGTPACRAAFPWSRNTGCYPDTTAVFTAERDTDHPIMTVPGAVAMSWSVAFTTASAMWMGVAAATQEGHLLMPADRPSLITSFEGGGVLEITEVAFHDGPFKGHPVVVFVTAENAGATGLDVPEDALTWGGDAATWTTARLAFRFDDEDGDGKVDPGGTIQWADALKVPAGPPDESFDLEAKISIGGSMLVTLTTDSCKKASELAEYRHYQQAVTFIYAAFKNEDPDLFEALDFLKLDTDEGFKAAHRAVADTSPGPGAYHDDPILFELTQGNCQFSVTGAWVKGI